jgi:acyl-ACP thioesterase
VSLDQPLAPPPPDGLGFTSSWPVRAADVDPDNRLRLDGAARYLQDIAWENLQSTFFASTDPFWVVRRTVVDVLRPVVWPDVVELRRWCSGMSTRWTNMRVSINSSGGGLIESEGFWINISEKTGLPTRISDEGLGYLAQTTDQHRLRWRPWLAEPPPPESERDTAFWLRATDIDQFNHLNNAAYWHAIEERLLDLPKLVAVPHRAVLESIAPIFPRESVSIRSRLEGGDGRTGTPTLKLWYVVDNDVRAVARVAPLTDSTD